MYYGMRSGGMMPYSLGEVAPNGYGRYLGDAYNLSGDTYAPDEYSPHPGGLGNFFDDLQKIASKVGFVAGQASQVASGKASVATIPTDQATLTIPMGGVATSIPLWVILAGLGGVVYFASRKRR